MNEENVSYETIYKKLLNIQNEINVPKKHHNDYGNYSYRNAEDILAEAKPLCVKHNCLLSLEDGIEQIGDRFYVVATAELINLDIVGEKIVKRGYAREPLEQKQMSSAMITGSSSSYARKYALNGLFCLDDGQDADSEPVEQLTGEEFAVKYNDVLQKLQAYGFNPRAENAIEYVAKKTGVNTLDIGKLMLNVNDGMKVLALLEEMLKLKEGSM